MEPEDTTTPKPASGNLLEARSSLNPKIDCISCGHNISISSLRECMAAFLLYFKNIILIKQTRALMDKPTLTEKITDL